MNRSNTVTVGVEYQRLSQREQHDESDDADSGAAGYDGASTDSETEEWSALGSRATRDRLLLAKQRFDLEAADHLGRAGKMKIEMYEVGVGMLISYCLW